MSIADNDDNEGPPDRTFKRPAPRIDSFRNQIDGTIALLGNVRAEAEDLHVLGYERPAAAADRAHVKGGDRDYALDTHGDKRARDAYRNLADVVLDSVEDIAEASHDALRFLRVSGVGTRRTPRQLDALQLAEQITNQSKRIVAGEYTPVRRHPQPGQNEAVVALRAEGASVLSERDQARMERDQARDAVRLLVKGWPGGVPVGLRPVVERVLGRETD